jgi:hypothetical protein
VRTGCYAAIVLPSALPRAAAIAVALVACSGKDDEGTPWRPTASADDDGTDAGDDGSGDDDDGDASDDPSDPDDSTDADDDGPDASASTDSGGEDCTLPDPAPAWLEDDLRDTVARLSGEVELEPGTTLYDRASPQRRAQAAAWLLLRFGEIGLVGESNDYGTGTNVFARLPATTSSAGTLVFGAHMDSVPGSPGADDNASGTAVVLTLARQLQDVPCRRYDVIFVLFDEEEVGLVGSTAFASKLVQDEEDVVSVHTADQLGWDGDGDRRVEVEQPDADLFEFYTSASAELASPIMLVQTDSGFTDHESFRSAGFAAVGLSEEWASGDTTPYYHLPGDRYDTVDFGYLVANATLVNHAFARALSGP